MTTLPGIEAGGQYAMAFMKAVDNADAVIDDVNVFAKLIKKSEDAAQGAL